MPSKFPPSTKALCANHALLQGARCALSDAIRTEICDDLERIASTVQRSVLEGVADVIAEIRAAEDESTLYAEALGVLDSSVRDLAYQVAALFEIKVYMLRRHQFSGEADTQVTNDGVEASCSVTIEDFMQRVKPPARIPSLLERLGPYIPQLTQLRKSGYSYAKCAQFLRENGISTYPAAIGNVLREAARNAQLIAERPGA